MFAFNFVLLSGTFFFLVSKGERQNVFSITKWLQDIHNNDYDKLTAPGSINGGTTDVTVRIYVEHIGNFKSTSMDYDLSIFFIQHWTDERLSHTQNKHLTFSDKSQLDRLWTPDIYFSNSKMAQYNYVMVPNLNVRIWENGHVRLGTRVLMKVLCHMDLTAYPLDEQVCHLKIQTCASSQDVVNVTWASATPVTMATDIEPTDLKVKRIEVEMCDAVYFGFSYSCLLVKFFLQRSIEYSLLQTYIPTSFIVIISWISFWIDPSSVPGRVSLPVTTLLTLSTQAVAMHFHLPPVDYATALDIWFCVCILFLFCSLIEFALVNMYWRLEQQQLEKIQDKQDETALVQKNPSSVFQSEEIFSKMRKAKLHHSKALCIDRCSRVLFPLTFVVFCAGYWSNYLSKSYRKW